MADFCDELPGRVCDLHNQLSLYRRSGHVVSDLLAVLRRVLPSAVALAVDVQRGYRDGAGATILDRAVCRTRLSYHGGLLQGVPHSRVYAGPEGVGLGARVLERGAARQAHRPDARGGLEDELALLTVFASRRCAEPRGLCVRLRPSRGQREAHELLAASDGRGHLARRRPASRAAQRGAGRRRARALASGGVEEAEPLAIFAAGLAVQTQPGDRARPCQGGDRHRRCSHGPWYRCAHRVGGYLPGDHPVRWRAEALPRLREKRVAL
mmetsp:Transcript_106898/g.309240  ORF Transcript_106898/g.309240 Transcript_106898/m.309240 type:complete len:267 (+) Transcript_106898:3028-3828(+)